MTIADSSERAKSKKLRFNEEEDTSCGFGSWRPEWLQKYATAKFFAINFSVVGILQAALFTYMVGIISTLEKRYAFESKISGFILIADNLSGMVASPIVGYLGSKYNRSILIAMGEFIVAFAAIANFIPYYLYGAGTHLLNKDITSLKSNMTNFDMCLEKDPENCSHLDGGGSSTVLLAVIIFWFSSFANGLGYTAFYTIGLPYIDDNIKKKNSAMYLSAIAALRLVGPTVGFVLASFCLSIYENPFIDPGIDRRDPRWIGAWWLGFVILGVLIIIFSLPMLMFPLKFKDKKVAENEVVKKVEDSKFDGAWSSLKRLSTNGLLLFHVWGSVFRIIGYLGFYIIKPKYMELQYRQSASSASFFTGATSVVSMAIGTMSGGVFIRYMKPKPRYLAGFVLMVEMISSAGIISSMFLNCPTPQYSMLPGNLDLCSTGCECSTKVYQPVCGSDGVTNYFSPCFAGCKTYDKESLKFGECGCAGGESSSIMNFVKSGRCESDCDKFPYYIAVHTVGNLIGSMARTGDTIITLRSVEPRDKNFAMGVTGMIFSIFAFIPYPLIFGAITDAACLVWEKSCDKTGNCWLYDMDKLRVYLHVGAFGFIVTGIILQIGMLFYVNRIQKLYDDDEEEDETNQKIDANRNELVSNENPVELKSYVITDQKDVNGVENGHTTSN